RYLITRLRYNSAEAAAARAARKVTAVTIRTYSRRFVPNTLQINSDEIVVGVESSINLSAADRSHAFITGRTVYLCPTGRIPRTKLGAFISRRSKESNPFRNGLKKYDLFGEA